MVRKKSPPWRMNPPRHWPLDPHRSTAARSHPGAVLYGARPCPPTTQLPAARVWRQSTPPARYAPAVGTAQATCVATVRLRAGRPAPTSRTFIPSRATPCRVPCGGSLRRWNNRDQHRAQAIPPWARWTPKIRARQWPRPVLKPNRQNAASLRWHSGGCIKASLYCAMPSDTGPQGQCPGTSNSHALQRVLIAAITAARIDMPCWICSIVRLAYPRISPADRGRSSSADGANSGPTG